MTYKTPIRRIEEQLNKIFEDFSSQNYAKVSFILSKLDLNIEEKSYSKYPLETILKLYIYKRVKGLGNHYEKLVKYFKENSEEALQLGFLKNINNNVIFPPKRTYNHYRDVLPALNRLCHNSTAT